VTTTAPAGHESPRLNPFAFPSDTTFRFFLLIVSIVGVNLFFYNWLYFSFADNQSDLSRELACLQEQIAGYEAATSLGDIDAANDRFSQCRAAINRPKGTFMLGGVALLLVTAFALFLLTPLWKLRRGRLTDLPEEDAPEVTAELRSLVREAGLEREPRFVWNPLNAGSSGLAFGHIGRYYVALSGGLVTQFFTDRPGFRAVVLHELAHLRNRDVSKTYFTISLWHAFVLVGVLPFLVSLVDDGWNTAFDLGWRLVAMTLLVYLTRNAVLRARETYADVRASTFPGVIAPLTRILRGLPARSNKLVNRAVGLHPSPEERLRALDDTGRLFGLGTFEAFGAGIAATIAYAEVVTLVGFYNVEALSTMWISALVFAPLAVGIVGLGAWRGTFGALARRRPRRGSWPLGLALGTGFLVGQQLSLSSALGADETILSTRLWGIEALWAAIVLVALGLFVTWITASASLWLPAVASSRSPRWAYSAGLAVAAGVLTAAMGIFFLVRNTREVIEFSTAGTAALHAQVAQVVWAGPTAFFQFVMDPEILWFAERPVVWPAVLALWAFPLAAAFVSRSRRSDLAAWGTLEPPGVRLPATDLRLGRAAAIGAVGAILVYLALLALRAGVHFGVSETTRARDEFLIGMSFWMVTIALVGQGIVAAVTVARIGRGAVLLGLFAAFLTGVGGAAAIITQPSLGSCVEPIALRSSPCEWIATAGFVRLTFEQVLVEGLLAALAGAGLAAGLKALRSQRNVLRRPAPASPA
jgi:Zn-dependent protease with chaperone function